MRAHELRDMGRLLRRRPGSFLLAVLLAAAAFTVPLTAASIARSVAPLAEQLPLGPEINLFLAASASAAEIRQLQSQLAGRPGVTKVEWITREAALKALAQRSGNSGLTELKVNPLPDVLVVTLARQTAPAEVEQALGELSAMPRVDSAATDAGWHRQLVTMRRAATVAGAVFGGLAAALLALIVLASIRLLLSSSAAEQKLLRQIGAEDRFVVRPFTYAGALTLGCGMALATGLAWAGLAAIAAPAAELAQAYGATLVLQPLPVTWLAALGAGAAVVGGATAALVARSALPTAR